MLYSSTEEDNVFCHLDHVCVAAPQAWLEYKGTIKFVSWVLELAVANSIDLFILLVFYIVV